VDYVCRRAILDAIVANPGVQSAAVTGSQAREGGADGYSDLDCLLVAREPEQVRDVRSWFPRKPGVLLCEFHLARYCSVLLDNFDKVDLAIVSPGEAPSSWVVLHYEVIKGDHDFEARLASAAAETRRTRAAQRNPDACMNNLLLLLTTAAQRVRRGEDLRAHAFLSMAGDMLLAIESRTRDAPECADVIDLRRRLERVDPDLGRILHECLFGPPRVGAVRMARYLSDSHGGQMSREQVAVLRHIETVLSADLK
jgi:hypothetical protein